MTISFRDKPDKVSSSCRTGLILKLLIAKILKGWE